jgi:rubredoxin
MSSDILSEDRTCPRCASPKYGPLDLGWPFGLPQHNPNPHVTDIVWVCINCEYVLEPNGPLT